MKSEGNDPSNRFSRKLAPSKSEDPVSPRFVSGKTRTAEMLLRAKAQPGSPGQTADAQPKKATMAVTLYGLRMLEVYIPNSSLC